MASYKYAYDDYGEKKYTPSKLKTNRQMWKLMLLNILTLGIYSIIFFIPFSFDIDKVAPRRDGRRTMNYIGAYLLALFTFAIVMDIWHYQIASRVEDALSERSITYDFGWLGNWKPHQVRCYLFYKP